MSAHAYVFHQYTVGNRRKTVYSVNKIYPKVMADLKAEEDRYAAILDDQTSTTDTKKEEKPVWPYTELNRPCWPVPLMQDSVNQLFPQVSILR